MGTLTHLNISTDMTVVNQHINTMLALWSHEEGVAADARARGGINYSHSDEKPYGFCRIK